MADNYQISRDRAQAYFLGFDQEKILQEWDLEFDGQFIYVNFIGRPYAIHRQTGGVTRRWSGEEAGFNEVLSIFDLLCHHGPWKALSGRFAPVNSLRGRPPTAGVETNFYHKSAACFDRDWDAFHRACQALGGKATGQGDVGYEFPIFQGITARLKFYGQDEDFPASVTILWDENLLQYIFYETVFYIAGFLLQSIQEQMDHMTGSTGNAD